MNRDQVEHALKPIWVGFAAAEARLEELLAQSQGQPVDRNTLNRLRHESEIQEAIAYLRARARAFAIDGLMTAVDAGRAVYTWPNVYPAHDAASKAVAAWKESRTQPLAPLEPMQRPA